jgi:hypothetical protein
MAEINQDFHPAPPARDISGGLHRLMDLLNELDTAQGQDESAAPSLEAGACSLLRLRLAVRGWVSPLQLLKDVAEDERDAALRVVGAEVELSERTRPGQWFMALSARKRVFSLSESAQLRDAAGQELAESDGGDPVRLALLAAMMLGAAIHVAGAEHLQQEVAQLRPEVLQELGRMVSWGIKLPGLSALAATAAAEQRRRLRDRQRESMGATIVFGREREQETIRRFLRRGRTRGGVRTLYLSGIGGSGKSTLLLAAEDEVRSAGDQIVVRLDFDNPFMNPRNPEQMDIQLLGALAVEVPGAARQLHQVSAQLQSMTDHRARAQIKAAGTVHSFSSSESVKQGSAQANRARYASNSGSDAESASNSQHYGRISAMAALESIPAFTTRTTVLLLDTLENVTRLGADGIDSVLAWLNSLGACLPRPDGQELRVVIAGRDRFGSPDMQALAQRFESHGICQDPDDEVALSDLAFEPACALLMRFGMPADDAALAAAALPRNPLVLRLAARTYRTGKDDLAQIQQAYRERRIDRQTAAGYLAQRVVQHIPRPSARRYVLAALSLMEVTERLLQDIVIPAVDGFHGRGDRDLARKVYRGLVQASWLTIEDVPGSFHWHAELRALALPMIQADPVHAAVADKVLQDAHDWYAGKRSAHDRELAERYRDETDRTGWDGGLFTYMKNSLRKGRDDSSDVDGEESSSNARRTSDREAQSHRKRLEGVGGQPGEGDRLVAQGHVERALQLYRDRPTRDPGAPPTFVIRALALSGATYGADVDPGIVLAEVRGHMNRNRNLLQRREYERLYWLTRLVMLDQAALPRAHIELLADVCQASRFKRNWGPLYGLVGMLEALQSDAGPLCIAPAAWPPPNADVGPEQRLGMTRTRLGQFWSHGLGDRWISTRLGSLLQFDTRWPGLLIACLHQEILQIDGGESRLEELERRLERLRGAPLLAAEELVASCREVRVRINLGMLEPDTAPALLRGTLVEFHAPLACVLSDRTLWGEGRSTQEILRRLLQVTGELRLPQTMILPFADFESEERRNRYASNLHAAIGALIVGLDRSAALAQFTLALLAQQGGLFPEAGQDSLQRLRVLCERYGAWNEAVGNGRAAQAVAQEAPVR